MNLNQDILFEIIKNTSPDNLQNICSTNKQFYELCKNNKKGLSKVFLDKYQVDYKDQVILFLCLIRYGTVAFLTDIHCQLKKLN